MPNNCISKNRPLTYIPMRKANGLFIPIFKKERVV